VNGQPYINEYVLNVDWSDLQSEPSAQLGFKDGKLIRKTFTAKTNADCCVPTTLSVIKLKLGMGRTTVETLLQWPVQKLKFSSNENGKVKREVAWSDNPSRIGVYPNTNRMTLDYLNDVISQFQFVGFDGLIRSACFPSTEVSNSILLGESYASVLNKIGCEGVLYRADMDAIDTAIKLFYIWEPINPGVNPTTRFEFTEGVLTSKFAKSLL
jgi:hypothetical protein